MFKGIKIDPKVVADLALFLGVGTSIYYALSYLINQMADGPASSSETRKKMDAAYKKLKLRQPDVDIELNEYEKIILADVIAPDDINMSFRDIGGLDDIVGELKESVLIPLICPEIFAKYSPLIQAPKGVLLYGPPGCGKTMLAKALASESHANFINVKMSAILDKWYGQSNKLVAAIFSLAEKLQPSIIFLDEIDSFLRERQKTDHEITSMLKAEFMTLWDGINSSGRVLVLGATNRPNDLDKAILRRMPTRFAVKFPNSTQRLKILELTLQGTPLDPGLDLEKIVSQTAGMSGSDLKEVCRDAAMVAARESLRDSYDIQKKLKKMTNDENKNTNNTEDNDNSDSYLTPSSSSSSFSLSDSESENEDEDEVSGSQSAAKNKKDKSSKGEKKKKESRRGLGLTNGIKSLSIRPLKNSDFFASTASEEKRSGYFVNESGVYDFQEEFD